MLGGEAIVAGGASHAHQPRPGSLPLWRAFFLILALVSMVLCACAGTAVAATISGTVTDGETGAAIGGAEVMTMLDNEPIATAITDTAGRWEVSVSPGSYDFTVFAPGYYIQGIGARPAQNKGPSSTVGALGLTGVDAALVSSAKPYVGLSPATLEWSHAPHKPFRSMVISMAFGAYVAIPSFWPADQLTYKLVDARGRPFNEYVMHAPIDAGGGEPFGGGGGGESLPMGSTEGCSFFGTSKRRPDVEHLSVVAFLDSAPTYSAHEPVAVDSSGCARTRLKLRKPFAHNRHEVFVSVELQHRLPVGVSADGTLFLSFNGGKPVVIRQKAPSISIAKVLRARIHRGINRLKVWFQPRGDSIKPPQPKTIKFRFPA